MASMCVSVAGLKHQLLNAKPENVERESETVGQSGRKGSITIATNMAGRGTDIILGGNPDYMARYDPLLERSWVVKVGPRLHFDGEKTKKRHDMHHSGHLPTSLVQKSTRQLKVKGCPRDRAQGRVQGSGEGSMSCSVQREQSVSCKTQFSCN